MSAPVFHRIRKPGGGFETPVPGEPPHDGFEREGVVWVQLPGNRMAQRVELWTEVDPGPALAERQKALEARLYGEESVDDSQPHRREGVNSALLSSLDESEDHEQ